MPESSLDTMKFGKDVPETPAALGYRLLAEWEPHEATWIGWPHNKADWPGKFAPVPWVYAEIVRRIAPGEAVRILGRRDIERQARRVLRRACVDLARVEFFDWPTDRGWTRDFGPFFVRRAGPPADLAVARFRFNAWAKYPEWKHDDSVPERVAKALGLRLFRARTNSKRGSKGGSKGGRDVCLEGGSIDVNGRGTLLTTEECLLDQTTQVRNPGLSRQDLERVFRDYLGVTNVLWLGRGIAGDDTHGHVDDVSRFVGPRTVVLCREDDPSDLNYVPLEENRERLAGLRLEDGSRIEVVPLPMPAPLYFDGRRLPASYANFYFSNAAVLVPTFNDPKDRIALGTLAELIPGRPVVGIHAVDLVWGLGTLHCLTLQQPSAER
jgi:agmatine deiminase